MTDKKKTLHIKAAAIFMEEAFEEGFAMGMVYYRHKGQLSWWQNAFLKSEVKRRIDEMEASDD